MSILNQCESIKVDFTNDQKKVEQAAVSSAVEQLRLNYLGRKGKLTALMEELRNVSKEERPVAGKAVNVLRQFIEGEIQNLVTQAKSWELKAILDRAPIDVTLPVSDAAHSGSLQRWLRHGLRYFESS